MAAPSYAELKEQLKAAQEELETLKQGNKKPEPKEGHQIIFISSKYANISTKLRGKEKSKVVTGSVNGIPFEVECDKQVEVSDEIAGALAGLLAQQAAGL